VDDALYELKRYAVNDSPASNVMFADHLKMAEAIHSVRILLFGYSIVLKWTFILACGNKA
jgi:hypothetical protein